MLPEERSGQAMPAGGGREFYRSASDEMSSGAWMVKGRKHLPCGRLWIAQDFGKVSDQRTGNSGSVQSFDPLGGRALPEYLMEQGIEALPIGDALRIGQIVGVPGEVGPVDGIA